MPCDVFFRITGLWCKPKMKPVNLEQTTTFRTIVVPFFATASQRLQNAAKFPREQITLEAQFHNTVWESVPFEIDSQMCFDFGRKRALNVRHISACSSSQRQHWFHHDDYTCTFEFSRCDESSAWNQFFAIFACMHLSGQGKFGDLRQVQGGKNAQTCGATQHVDQGENTLEIETIWASNPSSGETMNPANSG